MIAVGTDLAFRDVVRERSGEDVHGCFYCQKCTAGCPTAFVMDYKPAQLLWLMQLGQKETVLASSAIWMCVGCETCGTRCPNRIRLAPVMDVLRHMALEEGYAPEPAVYALHRSFLDSIKMWGRVHELTMLMEYKTLCLWEDRSLFFRGLTSDVKMGADLILKRKMSFLPERVKRLDEVKRLYEESVGSGRAQGSRSRSEVGR